MAEYNGWTNYETWVVALRMDNDQGSYNAAREQAAEVLEQATEDHPEYLTPKERAVYILSETFKEEHEEANPLADAASVYSDLLGAALSEVNWHEIATNVIDEVSE